MDDGTKEHRPGEGVDLDGIRKAARQRVHAEGVAAHPGPSGKDGTGKKGPTQAEILIKLAEPAELFHAPDQTAFATVDVDGHAETHAVQGRGFRSWLRHRFFLETGKGPSSQALQDALGTVAARALFEGPTRDVHVRVAYHGGRIFLDLACPAWRCAEVSREGWHTLDRPPGDLRFRRAPGMLPLPEPERGGTLADLRPFVNIQDDADWLLVQAWLSKVLFPQGPDPVLILQGEQATAKSFTATVLRACVDPSTTALRSVPREEHDLILAANNARIVAFDNLSGCAPWLSDALCRLSTGAGFATRTLYTDSEETLFSAVRPIVLTGIDAVASRHDLADRSIVVTLQPIPEGRRRTEADLLSEFEAVRPKILGALLDAAAVGLRNHDRVHLDRLPRMADFARWAAACEPALDMPAGLSFMDAYSGKRAAAVEDAIEGDPIAKAVREFMADRSAWTGTPATLLEALADHAPDRERTGRYWPANAKALGKRLRRSACFLRAAGLDVDLDVHDTSKKRTRLYEIRRVEENNVRNVRTCPNVEKTGTYVRTLPAPGGRENVRTCPNNVRQEELDMKGVTTRKQNRNSDKTEEKPDGSDVTDVTDVTSLPLSLCEVIL